MPNTKEKLGESWLFPSPLPHCIHLFVSQHMDRKTVCPGGFWVGDTWQTVLQYLIVFWGTLSLELQGGTRRTDISALENPPIGGFTVAV